MMRTVVLSAAAVAALAVTANPAAAQYRARRVVVVEPVVVGPVGPVVVAPVAGGVVVPAAGTPGYVVPASYPGYVGPYVAPVMSVGRGHVFYPGYGYSSYPGYRYWR